MSFMEKQVREGRWLRVETMGGSTEYVSVFDTGLDIPNGNNFDDPDVAKTIGQYTEDRPETWENIKGYGARLSAPGYLDCTEWTVFDTSEEAEEYLKEMDIDEDSTDDED